MSDLVMTEYYIERDALLNKLFAIFVMIIFLRKQSFEGFIKLFIEARKTYLSKVFKTESDDFRCLFFDSFCF
jgi:DNA repair exonuclease SbcCD ATPase subunit